MTGTSDGPSPATPQPPDPDGPTAADGSTAPPPTVGDAMRFAFGMLTVLPVNARRWDRATAGPGMRCAPLVGLAAGAAAALLGAAVLMLGGGPLLAAVAAVAVPAVLTRGLHLDGLADTADGLGSGRPAAQALLVMKRSDIGPFGVVTLVLVLLAQVAALAELFGQGVTTGAAAALLAAVTARTALTVACRSGVPAARPDGLGAAVAGSVSHPAATAVALGTLAVGTGLGAGGGPWAALHGALAAAAGLGAAQLLLRRCRSRLGGVNGDVFGALAETAGTAVLVVMSAG